MILFLPTLSPWKAVCYIRLAFGINGYSAPKYQFWIGCENMVSEQSYFRRIYGCDILENIFQIKILVTMLNMSWSMNI